jgi:plastocyanin domain-containing protein
MNEIFVTAFGFVLIAFIVWWFWFSTPEAAHANRSMAIDIQVKDGTYQPAVIEVPAGQALSLTFRRHDVTPCAEKVVFGTLGISADLPLGRTYNLNIPALEPGSYEFTCQMGMYRGRLIVK